MIPQVKMLRYLRNQPYINQIGRFFLKRLPSKYDHWKLKWRTFGEITLKTHGSRFKMISRCDDGIVDQLFYQLNYAENLDLRVFTSFLKPNTKIVDIGANTGIYSLLCSVTEKNSYIYAFEPNPVNEARLRENVSINDCKNIEILKLAVGTKPDRIQFTVPLNNIISDTSSAIASFSRSTYQGKMAWKSIEVDQISLDGFFLSKKENIDLIKIDVEGYEIDVLKGGVQLFKFHRPKILLETFPDNNKRAYLNKFLADLEYDIFKINENGIYKDVEGLSSNFGLNYLLIPKNDLKDNYSFDELKSI